MSDKKVKNVTDPVVLLTIFSKIFVNKNVFLKRGNDSIPVEFINYNAGIVTLKILESIPSLQTITIYVKNGDEVIFSNMRFIKQIGLVLFTFEANSIQLIEVPRKESRYTMDETVISKDAIIPYITHIITDFSIITSLTENFKRMEFIRSEVIKKIAGKYPISKVGFVSNKKGDPRMLFFQTERHPYFIKEFSSTHSPAEDADLHYFMTNIFPKDLSLSENHCKSEIAVPLLYKFMMPFGYIQINTTGAFTEEDNSYLRKLGMSISTIVTNDTNIVKSTDESLNVVDLSMSGFSVIFKNKPLIKYFKEKSFIIFTMFLTENRNATVLAVVKNISFMDNNEYRIGCEVINIDAIGEVSYSEFIEEVAAKKNRGNKPPTPSLSDGIKS